MIINDVFAVRLDKPVGDLSSNPDLLKVAEWLDARVKSIAGSRQFHLEFRYTFTLDEPLAPDLQFDIYRVFVSAIFGYTDPIDCIDKDDLWYAPRQPYPVVRVPSMQSKPLLVGGGSQPPSASIPFDVRVFGRQHIVINNEVIDYFYKAL